MADWDRVLRLLVAYDGTDFAGWQIQPEKRTIQGELRASLVALGDPDVLCLASGRTDAGVHAQGQVVSVRTSLKLPTQRMRRAIQARLPEDIVVRAVADAPLDFDPTRQALAKMYRYTICQGWEQDVFVRKYALHHAGALDLERMACGAGYLLGTHDFRAFETRWPNRASSIRTITKAVVYRADGQIRIEVESNGFLYNMVRAIVGTLLPIGRGTAKPESVKAVIESGKRSEAGSNAPAHGLCLMRVTYPPHLNEWHSEICGI